MKQRWYVGYDTRSANVTRTPFRSATEPTRESHGDTYAAVMGPFRTRWAARFTAACGQGNPHIQHVDDAERLCRLYPEYR